MEKENERKARAILSDRLVSRLDEAFEKKKAPTKDPRCEFVENLEHYISVLGELDEFTVELSNEKRDYHPIIREMEMAFYASDIIDYQYTKTAFDWMKDLKENIRTMTKEQVQSCITFVFRAEYFGEGLMLSYIEDGRLLLLLERLYEIQE